MRLKVQIQAKSGINIRPTPSIILDRVGTLADKVITYCDKVENVGDWIWFHLEDNRGWICHYNPTNGYLVNVLISESDFSTTPPNGDNPNPSSTSTGSSPATGGSGSHYLTNDEYVATNYGTQIAQNSEGVSDVDSGYIYQGEPEIHDYTIDPSFVLDALKAEKKNLNLSEDTFKGLTNTLFINFNRFKVPFPEQHLTKTFAYVFFTRPDLNLIKSIDSASRTFTLLENIQKDPIYYYLSKNDKNIILSLTKDFDASHDFHPFLSNLASSFELSDEYIKTVEHGETFTGYKMQYGRHNIESKTAGTFNINYMDDRNLTIFKVHKAWVEYISKVYRGELNAKDIYRFKKILDYAVSVYYILCGPDGETIMFWSKYFGVFPTNLPSSVLSWSKNSINKLPEYNINYSYSFKEDFNPLTLAEFNLNSRGDFIYKKTYENSLLTVGKTFTNAPFIESTQVGTGAGDYVFKLRFRH